MATTMTKMKLAPKGMGLNDFVALEEGFFADEGLDVEIQWQIVRGTQSRWKAASYFSRPQDLPYANNEEVVQGACAWGTICNASAGMGKVVAEAYGLSPWSIFVRPDSRIERPEDLKDVPIAVGLRAGSHFNVPYRLEKYLPLEHIKPLEIGGFGARLRALLDGEVEAASLLPPQIDMAKELGLREIMTDTFHTIWWVDGRTSPHVVRGYLDALQRAEEALDADLPKYLHLWKHAVPKEFADRQWNFSKFSRGERFVYQPIPKSEFDEVFDQVQRWGLDQFLKDRSYDNITFPLGAAAE
jgi:NitT/TauT family transport system substrate-binding protein